MNKSNIILDSLRKFHTLFFLKKILPNIQASNEENVDYSHQEASDIIKNKILNNTPFVVARLGTELYTLLNYKEVKLPYLVYSYKYITKQLYYKGWANYNIENLCNFTGFFPPLISEVEKFSALMIDELKYVDIWGCFSTVENHFKNELKHTIKIRLADIDPFLHENPWTESLKGKKVLVIHPFEKSIISQYNKREFLFENKNILPEFELKTIKAVQTLGNLICEFNDWFEALDSMKKKIKETDFDIALIGCGAYSLPLATYVKKIGKSAIYLGGGTQILFGIKGKRWESIPEIASLMNEYWIRPFPEDYPIGYEKIEGGCYW